MRESQKKDKRNRDTCGRGDVNLLISRKKTMGVRMSPLARVPGDSSKLNLQRNGSNIRRGGGGSSGEGFPITGGEKIRLSADAWGHL